MNKAVFLDRDGTIIKNIPYLNDYTKIEYLKGVFKAFDFLKKEGFLLVIVTNQSGIKRGLISLEQLKEINDQIIKDFKACEVDFAGIYFCPHLDEGCECRKPEPGMLLTASKDLDIDLSQSIMIGDSMRDIEAGERAGCKEAFLIEEEGFWESFEETFK